MLPDAILDPPVTCLCSRAARWRAAPGSTAPCSPASASARSPARSCCRRSSSGSAPTSWWPWAPPPSPWRWPRWRCFPRSRWRWRPASWPASPGSRCSPASTFPPRWRCRPGSARVGSRSTSPSSSAAWPRAASCGAGSPAAGPRPHPARRRPGRPGRDRRHLALEAPRQRHLDLAPSAHWPVPVLAEPVAGGGPVLVTVEYEVDPADHEPSAPRSRSLPPSAPRRRVLLAGVRRRREPAMPGRDLHARELARPAAPARARHRGRPAPGAANAFHRGPADRGSPT